MINKTIRTFAAIITALLLGCNSITGNSKGELPTDMDLHGSISIELPKQSGTTTYPQKRGMMANVLPSQNDVARYDVTVTCAELAFSKTLSGQPGETVTFERLIPGSYNITIIAFDGNGAQIFKGEKNGVAVEAGNTAPVVVNLDYATGTLAVGVTFPGENVPDPTNEKIAYISTREGKNGIYVMNTDGTDITKLTDNYIVCPSKISWSPDGAKILFVSNRDGNNELYMMNSDGSNQTRLTNDPGNDSAPQLTPDGTKIVFMSNRNSNYSYFENIYIMNVDGTNLIKLTNSGSVTTEEGAYPAITFTSTETNYKSFSISSDGTKIVFSCDIEIQKSNPAHTYVQIDSIQTMDLNGTNIATLYTTSVNSQDNEVAFTTVSYSPDGSKLFYISHEGEVYTFFIMNADGSNRHAISYYSTGVDSASWSADGNTIVFGLVPNYYWNNSETELYTIKSDGTNLVRLTNHDGSDAYPAWSPAIQ